MSRRSEAVVGSPRGADDDLRLPRPPGAIRRFWARHPLAADVVLALVGLVLSLPFPLGANTEELRIPAPVAVPVVTLLVLAMCGALLVRRRHPLVPFVLSALVQLSFLLTPLPVGTLVLLLTTYSVAVHGSSRLCWTAFGVAAVAFVVLGIVAAATGLSSGGTASNVFVLGIVLMLIGALVGVNVGGRKRYVEAIIDRSRQLMVERDQQARLAAAAERARIAREMHDIVAHSLTVVVALAEGARATGDPERARGAMDAAAETARGALTEMRSMLGVLRDGEDGAPLRPADADSVATVVEAAQRAGYPVTLTVTGAAELAAPVQLALMRIVQEGVTNAMRHAPGARRVDVAVAYGDPVGITVVNDGVTTPRGTPGFGVRGLHERVAHVGGRLTVGPDGADRWRLEASLPARPPEEGTATSTPERRATGTPERRATRTREEEE